MSTLTTSARNWSLAGHLSAAAMMMFVPSFGFLGPAALWLARKDDPSVRYHLSQAMAFQLAMTGSTWLLGILGTAFSCFLVGWLFYLVAFGVWVAGVVVPIFAGLAVNNGDDWYRYPLTGHLVEQPRMLV